MTIHEISSTAAPRALRRVFRLGLLAALLVVPPAIAVDTDCDGNESDGGGFVCLENPGGSFIPDVTTVAGASSVNPRKWSPKRGPTPQGDDSWFRVSLAAGQTFDWYGTAYDLVYISSNGYVSLGQGYTEAVDGASLPDPAAPNAAIFAYGDDLDASSAGTVWHAQGQCNVDRDGMNGNDACFMVRWDNVPHKSGGAYVTVTVQLALDVVTGEAFVEILSETGSGAASEPSLVGIENGAGTDGLWFKSGADADSRAADASLHSAFIFGFNTAIIPSAVTAPTATGGDGTVTVEWTPVTSGDVQGVLVLRKAGVPVDATPQDGTTYLPGMTLGVGNVVICDVTGGSSCVDAPLANDAEYHYAAFAYSSTTNYAPGAATRGYPRSAALYRWTLTTAATTLAPPGVVANGWIAAAGNDALLHRVSAADGTRNGFPSPVLGGAVQARPSVGDLAYPGSGDPTAFVASQDGTLARYDLETGALDGARDVLADAGCTGSLQSSAVVSLDAIDDNNNPNDDRVLVTTRCPAGGNQTLLYSWDLTTLHDAFNNNGILGMGVGSPRIHYVPGADTRVIVPHTEFSTGPSLVVHEIDASGLSNPAWSLVPGLGSIETTPALVQHGSAFYTIVGNTAGTLYVHDAMNRIAPGVSPLIQLDTLSTSDGAVRGVVASTTFDAGAGQQSNWVAWSTDGTLHGARLGPGGTFVPGTTWSVAIPSPSSPILLSNVSAIGDFRAYVGSSDGQLYEVDATDGTVLRTWLVEAGGTVGEPTFDFGTGSSQGIVVGSSGGLITWVGL